MTLRTATAALLRRAADRLDVPDVTDHGHMKASLLDGPTVEDAHSRKAVSLTPSWTRYPAFPTGEHGQVPSFETLRMHLERFHGGTVVPQMSLYDLAQDHHRAHSGIGKPDHGHQWLSWEEAMESSEPSDA